MPEHKDISDKDEDSRIAQIGYHAMILKQQVAFITDADPGKADRYISKLEQAFPGILIIGRGDGPVLGTTWVKVGPPREAK